LAPPAERACNERATELGRAGGGARITLSPPGRAGRAPYPGPTMSLTAPAPQRGTYQVRTFGCQMNVHDSERLTGLLEEAGYTAAPEGADARRGEVDVIVFNTCAVRENADKKLYGTL